MAYYRGNFYHDSEHQRGWLVGQFKDGVRKTDKVEIKFWRFKKGEQTNHLPKHQDLAIESTFVLKGKIKGAIDGREIELEMGDYVVLPPGVVSNFPRDILEDAEGLTVKAPSIKDDTKKHPT
jgi:quercetin dioxygenase-like cupin family protein